MLFFPLFAGRSCCNLLLCSAGTALSLSEPSAYSEGACKGSLPTIDSGGEGGLDDELLASGGTSRCSCVPMVERGVAWRGAKWSCHSVSHYDGYAHVKTQSTCCDVARFESRRCALTWHPRGNSPSPGLVKVTGGKSPIRSKTPGQVT